MMKKLFAILISFLMMIPQCFSVLALDEEPDLTPEADSTAETIPDTEKKMPEPVITMDDSEREIFDISLDETVTVDINEEGAYVYYRFVPKTDERYVFESSESGNLDPYVYLYDSDFNQISWNDDDGEGWNFRLKADLEADETYYFGVSMYYETGSFKAKLSVYVPEPLTSFGFSRDEYAIRTGNMSYIFNHLIYEPYDTDVELEIVSSNTEVIQVEGEYLSAKSKGDATITVTANGQLTDSALFHVGNYATGISRETWDSIRIEAGKSVKLDYILYPTDEDISDETITWSISWADNDCITVSADGTVTGVHNGSAEVKAEIMSGNYVTYWIGVYEQPSSITFRKEISRLPLNSSSDISSYVDYEPASAYSSPQTITSSNENVVRVEGTSLYGVSKGTADVTVTAENGVSATGTFQVGNYADYINRVSDYDNSLLAGQSVKLEYSLGRWDGGDFEDEEVEWYIDSMSNDCISLSNDGTVTALAPGYANVVASISNGSGVSYSIRVYESLTSLSFRREEFKMRPGSSEYIWNYLTYEPTEAWGTPLQLTSSDESVIYVDGSSIYAQNKGTARVTVTSTNGLTASADFTVGNYADYINRVGPYEVALETGQSKQLEYVLYPEDADVSDEEVTWSISYGDEGVISLDDQGVVTAKAIGYAEVRAEISNGDYTYYSIRVTEAPVSLAFGKDEYYLDKTYGYNIWNYVNVTPSSAYGYPLTIETSDPSVVRVDGNYIYGTGSGTATITATTQGGLSASAKFTVGNYAADISTSEDSVYLKTGETKQLDYTLYSYGYEPDEEEIVWEVTYGSNVVSVDQKGVVTALKTGTADVRATIRNGDSAYYTIHVFTDPETLKFKESTIYLDKFYGRNIWNYLEYTPIDAYGSKLTIVSSDTDVIFVEGQNIYGAANGTATVTVKADNGLSASATFIVGNYAGSISSDTYSYYLTPGETAQMEYSLYPRGQDFSDEKITWSVSGYDSRVISVDDNGLVSALKCGYATVEAKTRNGSLAQFYVEVNPVPKKIAFTSLDNYIAISSSKSVLNMLARTPSNADFTSITFTTGDEKIASVLGGQSVQGISRGTTILSGKTEDGLIAKTRVHVGNYASYLEPRGGSNVTMGIGDTKKLEFNVYGNDYSDDEFTWEIVSNENDCIRLSENGEVSAIRAGSARVRVVSKTGASAWFYIYVNNQLTSLKFTQDEYLLETGYYLSVNVDTVPAMEGNLNIDWSSSDPSIAYFDYASGRFGELRGMNEGTATIRASLRENPDIYAEAKVTVYKPVDPVSISVPASVTAYVDYAITVPVNVMPEKAEKDFNVEVSNDNVNVSSDGRGYLNITGRKTGTSVITLTSANGKVSAKTTVTVRSGKPAVSGNYYISHMNSDGYYDYQENPDEYVMVTGESYDIETYTAYGGYYPMNISTISQAVENTGLFENVRMLGGGASVNMVYMEVIATASKAGSAEIELFDGQKVKITVLDNAWLGTKVSAGNSIPAAIVNEIKDSDLDLRYDIAFEAAMLNGLKNIKVSANQKAVVQSWLDVTIDSYAKDAAGNIRLALTVKPKAKAVAMNKTAANTSAGTDLIAETELNYYLPAQIVIPVKQSIGASNVRKLSVHHKNTAGEEFDYDDALLDEAFLFINENNGLGTFTINALTSSYKAPVYTWTQKGEGYEVTAIAESEEGDPAVTETVTAVYTVETEPECFKAGKGVYTAAFSNPLFETQTMNVSIPAIGHHDYDTPVYTWSNDYRSVTATAVCKVCGEELSERAYTTYEVIKEPTETENGTGRYTAEFASAVFAAQTKDIVIPATGSGSDIIRIWFTSNEYTMIAGKDMVLAPHTDPEETTDTITFTSSDSSIVSNKGNLLSAHKAGKAIITATASNGVSASVTIKVVFADASDPNKFFYDPIYWAFEHVPQITTGTSDTTFSPNENCTRGHIVTFLYRAAGEPKVSGKMPFTDVKEGKFYYNAVLWAVQNNITTGTSATTFSPNENCTRGHIVTFLYRYLKSPKVSGTVPFTDVKEGKFYYDAVRWAVQNNITTGTSATTFSPNDNCTRGQAVTFLYRAVK